VIDLEFSVALLGAAALLAIAYAGRVARIGPARDDRVERARGSWLLGKAAMEMAAWGLRPLSRAIAAAGVTADAISWTSLALGVAAGFTIAVGHFGIGAALSLASFSCDALGGSAVRDARASSRSAAVLDAAVDRYAELFVFGGVALALKTSVVMLIVSLSAMAGAIMVSYAGAKAEAMRVEAPHGWMRREERVAYLVAGIALVPIAAAAGKGLPTWFADLPLASALGFIAVVANASAIWRLRAVAAAVRPAALPRTDRRARHGATEMTSSSHLAANDALH